MSIHNTDNPIIETKKQQQQQSTINKTTKVDEMVADTQKLIGPQDYTKFEDKKSEFLDSLRIKK